MFYYGFINYRRIEVREFKGLSDFFLNATPEEKKEVYAEVLKQANEEQRKILEEYYKEKNID